MKNPPAYGTVSFRIPLRIEDFAKAQELGDEGTTLLVLAAVFAVGSIDRMVQEQWIVFTVPDHLEEIRTYLSKSMGGIHDRTTGRAISKSLRKEIERTFAKGFIERLAKDIQNQGRPEWN